MFTNTLLVSIFSPAQIAGIVVVAVLLALAVAGDIVLAYFIHKRGERKLHDLELQKKREALLSKLKLMREGNYEFEEEEPEEQTDEAEEVAILVDEGDAVEEEVEEETGKVLRYNRSFTARITQASNDLKGYYSELKNYVLSFAGVKSTVSWRHETFHKGRTAVARFMVRGKTLCMCLASDPNLFEGTKYKVDDLSETNRHAKFPSMYRLKSDRKVGYAKELIDFVTEDLGLKRIEDYKQEDFTLPYKSTEVLVKNKLIKVVGTAEPDYAAAAAAKKGISYNRSFTAKIIQSNDALKTDYSELKNYLLSYGGVVDRSSWKHEAYLSGRVCVASIIIRGKTLCLCLAADPEKFKKTKYKVEDLSVRNKNNKTPCLYRVNGTRKMQYAKELIDQVFTEFGLTKAEREPVNYAVPYVSTNNLIARKLIRVVKSKPFRFRGEDREEVAAAKVQPKPQEATQPAKPKPQEEAEKPAGAVKPQEADSIEEKPVEAVKPQESAEKEAAPQESAPKPKSAPKAKQGASKKALPKQGAKGGKAAKPQENTEQPAEKANPQENAENEVAVATDKRES